MDKNDVSSVIHVIRVWQSRYKILCEHIKFNKLVKVTRNRETMPLSSEYLLLSLQFRQH